MSVRPVIGGQSPPYKAEHGISRNGRNAALHSNAARCRDNLPRAIGGCEGRDGLKKSGIFEIWGPKKRASETVNRCRMATSGKTAKTREIESFTSQEV
jgi:hypothetical protein